MITEIPDSTKEKFLKLCEFQGLKFEEVKEYALEFINSKIVTEDIQFASDEAKWRYVEAVVHNKYMSRIPIRQYSVIPIGFSGERTTRTNKKRAVIFAIVRDKAKLEERFTSIVLQGQFAGLYRKITPNTRYNTVELAQFKGGDLSVDDRAKFEKPEGIIKPEAIVNWLIQKGYAKRITCAETLKYPSRKQPNSKFTDQLDWRIIRAVISSCGIGKRDDGTEYGFFHVGDFSLRDNQAPYGLMTIWAPTELITYGPPSECDFLGTVTVDKESESSSMNCYMIVPIHAIEKAPEEKD